MFNIKKDSIGEESPPPSTPWVSLKGEVNSYHGQLCLLTFTIGDQRAEHVREDVNSRPAPELAEEVRERPRGAP